jgi:hypothetical protein
MDPTGSGLAFYGYGAPRAPLRSALDPIDDVQVVGEAGKGEQALRPQLLIPDRSLTHVVPVARILWIEAADNYVVIHTERGAPLMRHTLGGLPVDLDSGFVRTHHSAAVALAHVTAVPPLGKGGARIVVRDGVKVPCSRQYRGAVPAQLRGRLRPRSPQLGDDLPHDAGAAVMRGLLWGATQASKRSRRWGSACAACTVKTLPRW